MQPKIKSIRIVWDADECPDLSYLGEYSNHPGVNAIDRQARGDMGRGEYRYCNVTLSAEETGNPASVEQDYQRLESGNRGDWCMMTVRAEAEVLAGNHAQRFTSGALGGIESDSGADYKRELEDEQLADLKAQLEAYGVDMGNWDELVGEIERA